MGGGFVLCAHLSSLVLICSILVGYLIVVRFGLVWFGWLAGWRVGGRNCRFCLARLKKLCLLVARLEKRTRTRMKQRGNEHKQASENRKRNKDESEIFVTSTCLRCAALAFGGATRKNPGFSGLHFQFPTKDWDNDTDTNIRLRCWYAKEEHDHVVDAAIMVVGSDSGGHCCGCDCQHWVRCTSDTSP